MKMKIQIMMLIVFFISCACCPNCTFGSTVGYLTVLLEFVFSTLVTVFYCTAKTYSIFVPIRIGHENCLKINSEPHSFYLKSLVQKHVAGDGQNHIIFWSD